MAMTAVNRSASSPSFGEDCLPDEVHSLPYYHPDISNMQQVFAVVKQYVNHDGNFLLRKSFSKPGTLTVSVLHGKGVKHFNIAKQNGCYFLKDRFFPTIMDLVTYYKTHDVPNVEGIENVCLETPIMFESPQTASASSARSTGSFSGSFGSFSGSNGSFSESNGSFSVVEPFLELPQNGARRVTSYDAMTRSSFHDRKGQTLTSADGKLNTTDEDRQELRKVRSHSLGKNSIIKTLDYHSTFGYLHGSSLASDAVKAKRSSGALPPKQSSMRCRRRNQPVSRPGAEPSPYYSSVRNPYEEMAPELIKALREVEDDECDRCICGLLLDEAELSMGWTMHLSTEPESEGKLFFMGPDGETAWNLPLEVSISLSAEQQERIQRLLQSHP